MTGGQGIVAARRLPGGALVDERRHRRDGTGTVCPQPTVVVDGRPERLDGVLGDCCSLVCAGPVPAALR